MDLERLRRETEPEHQATEKVMPLTEPGLTMARYRDVLRRLYPLVISWESWADQHAPADLLDVVKSRQRRAFIEQDMQVLNIAVDSQSPLFPAETIPGLRNGNPKFRTAFLGAMYVMEGSTLGGKYIAQHIEKVVGVTQAGGGAYFRGYGEETAELWRGFTSLLADVSDDDTTEVILAAKAMFNFSRPGSRFPSLCHPPDDPQGFSAIQ